MQTSSSWDPYEVVKATGGLAPQLAAFNEVLASVRQIIECMLHQLKIFGVLGRNGRFQHS